MNKTLLAALLLGSILCKAQQGKFKMIGYQLDGCPIVSTVNKSTGERFYDSRVIGYPRFYPGYIVLLDGEKVEGNIAVFNDQSKDWAFVKRCLLIVPAGQQEAQYIKSGVALISQSQKKEDVIYDLYKGGYLERLVSGKARLSYNPDANTSKKVGDFVSQEFLDSMRATTARKSIEQSLKDGESIQASVEKAAIKDQLFDIGSSIEIVEKEYLMFRDDTGETLLITKSNYEQVIADLFKSCPSLNPKLAKDFARNYGGIVDAIKTYNENCK